MIIKSAWIVVLVVFFLRLVTGCSWKEAAAAPGETQDTLWHEAQTAPFFESGQLREAVAAGLPAFMRLTEFECRDQGYGHARSLTCLIRIEVIGRPHARTGNGFGDPVNRELVPQCGSFDPDTHLRIPAEEEEGNAAGSVVAMEPGEENDPRYSD